MFFAENSNSCYPEPSYLVQRRFLFRLSNGKKIVLTGFRDKNLLDRLKKIGAEPSGSVTKNTFAVIVKDKDEDTGKADQARKLGIK